jgi:hypothetical protein
MNGELLRDLVGGDLVDFVRYHGVCSVRLRKISND